MNKHAHFILIFCLVIVTVLSSGCGAVTAVPAPTLTPVPSQTPTETATLSPTKTPEPIHPEGTIFYDASSAIYSVDLKSQRTKAIFELQDSIQPFPPIDFLIANDFIYATIPSKDAERPGIFKMNFDGSEIEQLITERVFWLSSVDPTGQYLTYFNGQGLYLLDLQDNKSQTIIQQSGKYGLAQWFKPISWSPDGKKLIYDAFGLGGYDCELFVYDVATKKSRALLPDERTSCFAVWSPDGKRIVIANFANQSIDQSEVYILNIETDTLERISVSEGYIQFSGLAWLSGGECLLIGAGEEIYLYNETDGNLEVISDSSDWTQNFISSPDKNMVLYEQINVHGDAKTDLYLFNKGDKTTKKIYSHPGTLLPPAPYLPQPYHIPWKYSAVWSPDGTYIAYFTTPEPENYSRTNLRPVFLNIYSVETGRSVSFEVPAEYEIQRVYWIYP